MSRLQESNNVRWVRYNQRGEVLDSSDPDTRVSYQEVKEMIPMGAIEQKETDLPQEEEIWYWEEKKDEFHYLEIGFNYGPGDIGRIPPAAGGYV